MRVEDLQGMCRAKRAAQQQTRRTAIIDKAKAQWDPKEDETPHPA